MEIEIISSGNFARMHLKAENFKKMRLQALAERNHVALSHSLSNPQLFLRYSQQGQILK